MTDRPASEFPPAQPSKSNFLWIVVVLGAFGLLVLLAALAGGAYLLLERNGVFARPRPPRPAESLAEKRQANAEAFGKDAAQSDASPEEIEEFVFLLKRVAHIKTPQQTEQCFDIDRLFEEVTAASTDQTAFLAPGAKKVFRQSFAQNFTKSSLPGAFISTEVKRVKYLSGRDDAIVFSQHRDAAGLGMKMRWWVVRSGGQWKIYDFEDLDTGMRSSASMASVADADAPQGIAARQGEALAAVNAATALLGNFRFDEAEQQILPTFDVPLPKAHAAWRLAQLAIIQTSRGNWGEALDFADRAAEINPDMPLLSMLRAQALNGLERFEEGAAAARNYIAEVGGDDHGSFLLGTALAGMPNNDGAADAFREGLDGYSDSVDNLVGLAGVLPEDQMQEVADRFARFEQPAAHFTELAAQLVESENAPALAAVLSRNRELAPRDPHNDFYEGQLHWLRGEYDLAADSMRRALPQMSENERPNCERALRNALLSAGKAVEAYQSAPESDDTFLAVCNHLLDSRDPDGLDQVTALHAERLPDDAWLPYFRGEALVLRGRYEEAAEIFRPMLETQLTAGQRDCYQDEYLAAEINAGRPLAAYQTVPEASDAFLDAASRLVTDGNVEDLEKIVALHAKRRPDDPGLPYFRAEVFHLRGDTAEAAAMFESQLEKELPQAYRKSCQDEYLVCMLKLGKPVEGYHKAPDAVLAFKLLAERLADRYNGADQLESFIAAHAERAPDDAWLPYYRGRLLIKRSRYLEAAELLAPLVETAQDETLKTDLAEARRAALAFGGKPQEAYGTAIDRDVAFERTADYLAGEIDAENLAALIAARKADQADDPALTYYRARLAEMACDYAAVAELLTPAAASAAEGEHRDRMVNLLLEALYQTGDVKAACEAVSSEEAFNFLAGRLANDGNADALEELLAAYEPHAADDPRTSYYRGRVAQLRGRGDEVAEAFTAWFKAAGADEEDGELLETYLDAMAVSRRPLEAYHAASDAAVAFRRLAGELGWRSDVKLLEALVDARAKDDADDPWLGYWRGRALAMRGKESEALAAYESALRAAAGDETPGLAAAVWDEYLILGRALEAYALSGDAIAAFARLGGALYENRDFALLRKLVEAHEPQHADDPCLAWLKAELLIADGKYAEALELLTPQIADEENPYAYEVQAARNKAAAKAGRAWDVYRSPEDPREVFTELAAALYEAGDAAGLASLIEAHRESAPRDPWLHYYAAQRLRLVRQYAEADRAFAAALADPDAGAIEASLIEARTHARFDAGQAAAAYEELAPRLAALNTLVELCETKHDAAQLEQLIAAHRKRYPADVRLHEWELEIADWKGDGEALLIALDEHGAAMRQSSQWRLPGMRARALASLKRFDEARAVIESRERLRPVPYFRAMVEAAAGNDPAAARALGDCLRSGVGVEYLYQDPVLGPALRSEAFAAFRERHPAPPSDAGPGP